MSTIVIRTGKYAQLGSLILQTIVVIGALTRHFIDQESSSRNNEDEVNV